MATTIFTPDFYKMVNKELTEVLTKQYEPKEMSEEYVAYICIEPEDSGDCIEVELTCQCNNTVHDESFDHAFGTWHDPCPYLEFEQLDDIEDATVRLNGEKIEGFSLDDFWAAIGAEVEKHGKFTKGDKVAFGRNSEGIVAAYNTDLCKLKIISGDNTYYIETKYVRKATAV